MSTFGDGGPMRRVSRPVIPRFRLVECCPRCGDHPFCQFLPGQVVRFDWFGLRKRVWAVICWACKDIVRWESLAPADKRGT